MREVETRPHRSLLARLPRPVRRMWAVGSTSLAVLTAACSGGGAAPKIGGELVGPSAQEYFLPFSGLSRLTGGPHDSYLKNGIRDGIDIAPEVAKNIDAACAPGVRKVLDEPLVVASASGKVIVVGNEKDRGDKHHSVVKIETVDGFQVSAMHLDQIPVSVGDEVVGGQTTVGKVSCEAPPGGKTDALHVHLSIENRWGNQIPIENWRFSGWTVRAAARQYDGTMTKEGEQLRTAITGKKCGPDEASIKACGGIRNDLGSGSVLGETIKAPETTPAPSTLVQIKEIGSRGEDAKEYWWPMTVENKDLKPHTVTVRTKPWPGIDSPEKKSTTPPMTTYPIKTGLSKVCYPYSMLFPPDSKFGGCDKNTYTLRPEIIDSLVPELLIIDKNYIKNPDEVWSKISVRPYAPSKLEKPKPDRSSWIFSCDVRLNYTGQDYLVVTRTTFRGDATWQFRGGTQSTGLYFDFYDPKYNIYLPQTAQPSTRFYFWEEDHSAIILPKQGLLTWAYGKPGTSLYPPTKNGSEKWFLDDPRVSVDWNTATVTFNKVSIGVADGMLERESVSAKEFPLEGCSF